LISLHENEAYDFFSLTTGRFIFDDTVFRNNTDIKALSIAKLKDGTILLGRTFGLYQFSNGIQTKISIAGLGNTPVYSIFEDKKGILIGCDGVIHRIAGNRIIESIPVQVGSQNMVRNIKRDEQGNLWFNLWGAKGLYLKSGNKIINLTKKTGSINGSITNILLEKSGTVFASSIGKGISLFNNNYLRVYPESDNFSNAKIHRIVKTLNGGLLMGTSDGIAYLDPSGENIKTIKHKPDIAQYVRDIVALPNNQYLIGTVDVSLAKIITEIYEIPDENIRSGICIAAAFGWIQPIF
jgi:ligand-binding sensor domain-containing protein